VSWNDTLALKALIEQVPALAAQTFVSRPIYPPPNQETKVTTPYVVIHPADGADSATRLTGPVVTEKPRYTVHMVGNSTNQVQVLTGLLKDLLVPNGRGVIPQVTGRHNTRLSWSAPIPIQTETTENPPLVYQVLELGWTSNPA
jgi:hypothetical protein